jgi:tRNA uridine 5-carboxymethylaminomethyl modification enzyme
LRVQEVRLFSIVKERYDIIVVGAGHAGCEAAHAAAIMGSRVLLITMDMTKIAQMSCNPAMGGIAKGQIVKEIDALGGCSGIVTDKSMLQFRMLNRSKGPAMWSPRAQCDRVIFGLEWRKIIENTDNLDIWQDNVNELIITKGCIEGVRTRMGVSFYAAAVILTIGTFENGAIYIGRIRLGGGRISEPSSNGITGQLNSHGIESGRLKTGTPARIDGRTINFDVLEEQKGDNEIRRFSFLETPLPARQLSCFITYTNEEVHDILRTGFEDSPMYDGTITGMGPRYCPSIESKIVTFNEKKSHQLFLEPEGWETNEYYLNGFSSSLPLEIQLEAIHRIKGLEKAKIFRPGYAIEYDFFQPTQLYKNLETKAIKNLFFAGQINGTTGYEEAAAQGIMAGINAVLKLKGSDPLILGRNEAYIGVLIDDLVTKGVDEPYRMFTSRAEYRILLRQDNADERLTPKGIEQGIVSSERRDLFENKMSRKSELVKFLSSESISPQTINGFLEERGTNRIRQKVKLSEILLRPEIDLMSLLKRIDQKWNTNENPGLWGNELLDSVEIEHKYSGYIQREKLLAEKITRLDHVRIDGNIDIDSLLSISTEGRQKLVKYKPETIGQAARISGISPSDINVLLLYMGR